MKLPAPTLCPRRLARAAIALFLGLVSVRVAAEVRCAKLFGNHLVLQRDLPVPIWGNAAPGEAVTVEFAGQSKTTTADTAGKWRVTLAPLSTSAEPRDLVVRGTNTVKFTDVLVGEVWFCSGQSNMEKSFVTRKGQRPVDDHELEVAAARYPNLRLFQVPRSDQSQAAPGKFEWLPTTPDALRTSEYSAVAYFFGQQIHQTLDVPVGLVHASFGGTFIDAWLPPTAFAGPPLQGLEHRHYPAWVQGVQPTELYQSMIAPLAPFAVRGFLWYQGETNLMDGDVALYALKQSALIAAWRDAWEQPDAPFYGVLLAPMDYSRWEKFPVTAAALPMFWEQQVKALSGPHCGYVVTTDLVTNTHDIHPPTKRPIGLRLARLALAETYSQTDLPAHGPTYATQRIDGNRIELTFDHAEGLRARDGRPLTGFLISGPEQTFQPAIAEVENGKVIVYHDSVSKPAAVRFAWDETANPNLINGAGLPAVPFRTDDWPVSYLRTAPGGADATAAK